MPKFTIEDHEKRMREILTPKPQMQGVDLLTKFRDITKKRKAGTIPPIETREIQ